MSVELLFTVVVVVAVALKLLQMWTQGPRCTSKRRLDGKVAVITGANTGIGKVCARELCARGAKVVILCRSLERGEAAAQDIRREVGSADLRVERMDLSSLQSVRDCAARLTEQLPKVDILLNNAGVMACPESRTEDGLEMQIGTNHFGHFLLTNLLLPLLRKGGEGTRVVTVSSMAHKQGRINFEDINFMKTKYNPRVAYGQSKLANIHFSSELGVRESVNGIHTYSLHPGVIGTDLWRHMGETYGALADLFVKYFVIPFFKTVESGAQTSLFCCLDESIENHSGRYYSDCREKLPAPLALRQEDARTLWELSQQITGINPANEK